MDATLARHGRPARLTFVVVSLLGMAVVSGCHWWPRRQQSEIPVYSGALTRDELVRSLNANIEPLVAWRSTDAKIKARGMMPLVELGAQIAVERPRRIRLRAGLALKNMADLGSNDERFWFWFDGHPAKRTFTARHEHVDYAQHVLQIPFEPDWLLEALGVIPLNPDEYTLQGEDQGTGTVSLLAERMTSSGRIVRQVILVDPRHRLIVAHALFDAANGKMLARATLSDHRPDTRTGLVLPHRIELQWPQAELSMTMTLGHIEINPPDVPEQTWAMPTIPGYEAYEIAAPPTHRGPAGPARPLHAGPAEQFGEVRLRDDSGWSGGDSGADAVWQAGGPPQSSGPSSYGGGSLQEATAWQERPSGPEPAGIDERSRFEPRPSVTAPEPRRTFPAPFDQAVH